MRRSWFLSWVCSWLVEWFGHAASLLWALGTPFWSHLILSLSLCLWESRSRGWGPQSEWEALSCPPGCILAASIHLASSQTGGRWTASACSSLVSPRSFLSPALTARPSDTVGWFVWDSLWPQHLPWCPGRAHRMFNEALQVKLPCWWWPAPRVALGLWSRPC